MGEVYLNCALIYNIIYNDIIFDDLKCLCCVFEQFDCCPSSLRNWCRYIIFCVCVFLFVLVGGDVVFVRSADQQVLQSDRAGRRSRLVVPKLLGHGGLTCLMRMHYVYMIYSGECSSVFNFGSLRLVHSNLPNCQYSLQKYT